MQRRFRLEDIKDESMGTTSRIVGQYSARNPKSEYSDRTFCIVELFCNCNKDCDCYKDNPCECHGYTGPSDTCDYHGMGVGPGGTGVNAVG